MFITLINDLKGVVFQMFVNCQQASDCFKVNRNIWTPVTWWLSWCRPENCCVHPTFVWGIFRLWWHCSYVTVITTCWESYHAYVPVSSLVFSKQNYCLVVRSEAALEQIIGSKQNLWWFPQHSISCPLCLLVIFLNFLNLTTQFNLLH